MTSRSTSFRFLRAASRSAAAATRSTSRSAPEAASWSMAIASEEKTSFSPPARDRRARRYSAVSSGVSGSIRGRVWMREQSER
jgi:hypothetical protein